MFDLMNVTMLAISNLVMKSFTFEWRALSGVIKINSEFA